MLKLKNYPKKYDGKTIYYKMQHGTITRVEITRKKILLLKSIESDIALR